ncbi:hypothetical protein FB451DRAFT_1553163 [Mycena latifolia]|nr:hypothetical protein FB451DRAFT_1553163 [Mycena latifolia]
MFVAKFLALIGAAALAVSRTLSPSMASVLEARDSVAARCALKRDCPCELTGRLVDRFFEIVEGAIAARVCDGCCGDGCTCLKRNDIRCVGTEEEFVERAYEEAKRDTSLLPRDCST